jgi:hypothetical protein
MLNISLTQICTRTTTPPPPNPCTTLPATSIVALTLTPHKMLPPRKMVSATKMTGFRPKTSESVPQNGTEAALARRYADPIQAYRESGIWNDKAIVGSAVGMRTVSSATRKMDRQRAINANRANISGRECRGFIFVSLADVLFLDEFGVFCSRR